MKRAKRCIAVVLAALLLLVCAPLLSATEEVYAASPVIYGKDGWYFITADNTIPDYMGTDLFTADQLQLILQNFTNMRDTLEARGVEFIVYLAPNKENIYNEYMPDSYGELAPYTRIRQVYDLLSDNGIRVIYPEEMLREAKEKYPYDLYYRTDPHWNDIGTYLCSKLLMEEVGYHMPELEECEISPYQVNDMDCAKMLGTKLPDIAYTVTGYEGQEPCEKKFLIYGDSFGLELSECIDPIVSYQFMTHRDIYRPDMLDATGADVFVYQVLERFLDTILLYSCV